ncbi:hypothetical protein FE633_11030 [Streptomyces montanus]|uniref:Uncharacterized protein n=1 Tax=Streptomyces montanus TaxID=2580423 RepID=A0A5R9FQ71_9ACTN|nr:hypothetical protein [Streptomyces montanus]TLS46077.1 hypothetical protein FE633_11030 [Streptomyces montanus]
MPPASSTTIGNFGVPWMPCIDAEARRDYRPFVQRDRVDNLALLAPERLAKDVLDETARGVGPQAVQGAGLPLDLGDDLRLVGVPELTERLAADRDGGVEQLGGEAAGLLGTYAGTLLLGGDSRRRDDGAGRGCGRRGAPVPPGTV